MTGLLSGRPHTPAGYGIDSGADGLMGWGDVSGRLTSAQNYWLATAGKNMRPHVMPVWGLWLEGAFLFSTDTASRKARNLAANSHGTVHLESGDDVVIVEGMVEQVTDPHALASFVEAYDVKYGIRPDVSGPQARAYRLNPTVAFAWREKDYPKSATRWLFHRSKG